MCAPSFHIFIRSIQTDILSIIENVCMMTRN